MQYLRCAQKHLPPRYVVLQKFLPHNASVSSLLCLPMGVHIIILAGSSGVNHCVKVNIGLKQLLDP